MVKSIPTYVVLLRSLKFQSWIQDGGLQDGGRGTHVTHFVQL